MVILKMVMSFQSYLLFFPAAFVTSSELKHVNGILSKTEIRSQIY